MKEILEQIKKIEEHVKQFGPIINNMTPCVIKFDNQYGWRYCKVGTKAGAVQNQVKILWVYGAPLPEN